MIPADIQDRDCAANLIRKTRCLFPWIAKLFADGGYAGAKLKAALAGQPVELEIVKRTDNEGGFKVVRRRWVVERTLSWLRRNRRLLRSQQRLLVRQHVVWRVIGRAPAASAVPVAAVAVGRRIR